MLEGTVQITGAELPCRRRPRVGRSASRKVVLFLPPYGGPPLGPPAGLLCLASPLREAGYDVTIVDAAVTPNYFTAIKQEISDALCVGISLLTGPMIRDAIAASRLVKRMRPELPVIYGGWHPTLLPDQTLREAFVDIVVRNQGEVTFLEIVQRLGDGDGVEGVAGSSYRKDGLVCHNPDRPVSRLEDLPPPAYELGNYDAYEKAGGGRRLPYATSVGCPYACSYCTDTVFYNRRFNAHPADRVIEEVPRLAARHRIDEVSLLDSNFLVDTKRALTIAKGFLNSNPRFRWTFQASTDLLCRLSDEEVRLLGKSGLSHIGFGTESGSQQVLALMNKLHQNIPDMFEAARKCQQAGVRVTFNLIFGFPGETDAHRRETLRVMGEIAERFDNATFSPNLFTPYPGIPVWPKLEQLGVKQPESLEGWREIALGANVLPWMKGEPYEQVRQSMSVFLLANEVSKAIRETDSRGERLWLRAFRRPLGWRLKHQFYRWPVEVRIYQARKRLAMRRSLLTGQKLDYRFNQAC